MNFKTTIILTLVAGALVAAAFLLDDTEPTGPGIDVPSRLFPPIVGATRVEVGGLGRQVKLVLEKGDDGWEVIKGAGRRYPANGAQVRRIIETIDSLEPDTLRAASSEELVELGLDPGDYVVRMITPERTIELRVGKRAREGSVWVRKGTEGQAYIVSEQVLRYASAPEANFRDDDPLQVSGFFVEEIEVDPRDADAFVLRESAGWTIEVRGVTYRADEQECAGLIGGVVALRVGEFVESHVADLARYGLDDPRWRVTIDERVLLVGKDKPDANGAFYWMIEGQPFVYATGFSDDGTLLTDSFRRPASAYRDRSLFPFEEYILSRPTSVRLEVAGETTVELDRIRPDHPKWYFRSPERFRKGATEGESGEASAEEASDLVSVLLRIDAIPAADPVSADEAGFGDGERTARITLGLWKADARTFELGRACEIGSERGFWFREVTQPDEVRVAPIELLDVISGGPLRFLSRRVWFQERDNLVRIVSKRATEREVRRVRAGLDWVVTPRSGEGEAPPHLPGSVQTIVSTLHPRVGSTSPGMRVERWIADLGAKNEADLKQHGFDLPLVSLTLEYRTGETTTASFTIEVGSPHEFDPEFRYARMLGYVPRAGLVFLIDKATVNALDKPLADE